LNSFLTSKWTKALVFVLCCVPLGVLLWDAFHNGLAGFPDNMDFGANPIEFITHRTGDWTIRFIVITLAITPLRQILRQPQLIRFRRMLGLFAFFYGCLHFATWIGLDKNFDWAEMWKDVLKRRFITVGFTALVLMIPLALTSTTGMIRRLGGKRWRALHRLIYVSAILGVIHYYWLVKSDHRKPLMYAAFVAILLAWRLAIWFKDRNTYSPTKVTSASASAISETA
jgi:methionine sulfoxide reductase heme-binding subunit